ncbi:DUF7522 family protein [Halorussus lipolyticus]|uniref:DUF7522 family protein n=1 Tax=Halorussus lipolyticus TaxID=3034024 RepID=UPI0023E85FB8|nr:hypothetical protein [Halorussus sp. DT80]
MNAQSVDIPADAPRPDLCEALRTELGERLRTIAVGRISDREYDIAYMRDDIAEEYTDEMREEIFDEVVLESIAEDKQQDLFPALGDLQHTIRVFEDGINLVAWCDDEAVFVGLDPDATLLGPAVAVCRRML